MSDTNTVDGVVTETNSVETAVVATKPTVRKAKKSKKPVVKSKKTSKAVKASKLVVKAVKVKKSGPGRPAVYSPSQAKAIASLAKTYGATGAMNILHNPRDKRRPAVDFPACVKNISLPTIFKFAKANKVKFALGRPKAA